jgi:hypothetical protein
VLGRSAAEKKGGQSYNSLRSCKTPTYILWVLSVDFKHNTILNTVHKVSAARANQQTEGLSIKISLLLFTQISLLLYSVRASRRVHIFYLTRRSHTMTEGRTSDRPRLENTAK